MSRFLPPPTSVNSNSIRDTSSVTPLRVLIFYLFLGFQILLLFGKNNILFIPRHSDFFTLRQKIILFYSFLGIQNFHSSAKNYFTSFLIFFTNLKFLFECRFVFECPIKKKVIQYLSYVPLRTLSYPVLLFVGIYDQSLPSSCTFFCIGFSCFLSMCSFILQPGHCLYYTISKLLCPVDLSVQLLY